MVLYNIIKNFVVYIAQKWHKVNYYHTENIPKDKGCLICCNHRTFWDPVYLAAPIKTKLFFMAKNELFKTPLISWILKKLGAFPVKRGKKDVNAINHSIDLMNDNKFVVIFPEGTRSKTSEFLKPKAGAAMVAYKTKSSILPIRIIYHEPIKFRSQVDVIYGKLISPEELNISDNSMNDIKNASLFIMENIKNLNVD